MGKRSEQALDKRRHMNSQRAHEKCSALLGVKEMMNKKHKPTPVHTH